jgi:hypothetical protein
VYFDGYFRPTKGFSRCILILSLGSSDPFYLRFGIGISMILLFNKITKNMDNTERIVAVRNMRLYDSPDGNSAKPLIFKMD